jgi:hypothetical protein
VRLKEFIKNKIKITFISIINKIKYVFYFIFNSVYYIMDLIDSNFVLTQSEGGNIMAGGYIINDRLLIPSMSGGKNDNKEKKYAIPAGLFYIEVPYQESSVEIIYKNNNVLSDDIYDNLYDNVILTKSSNNKLISENNKTNKNTKRRKISTNLTNKKSRKQK